MKQTYIGRGMVLGAILGGVISLTHPKARKELKQLTVQTKDVATNVWHQPIDALNRLNNQLTHLLDLASHSLDLTIDAVNQVENLIQKYEDHSH